VNAVVTEPSVITSLTITPDTPTAGQSRITFTSSGPMTAVDVVVKGT